MAIYLDYEGIKGSVAAEGYKNMIALRHFKFYVFRNLSMKTGEMANRENAIPKFGTIDIEKRADASTIGLFRSSLTGSEGKRATLHFIRTGTDKLTEYMTYTLENCLISKYLIYDTEFNKLPHEKIRLSFTSILISETVRNAENLPVKTLRSGYDLVKATKL